jgi:uncharacterized damage-inducible protein DinB
MTDNIELLKYPIGKFRYEASGKNQISNAIESISALPVKLSFAVAGLSDTQLNTSYRDGGWTIRQVIHHLPDSHLNAYTRFKLAMTEINPSIRPYDETAWAECEDAKNGDIKDSLDLLDALHRRWVTFLKLLSVEDLERTYFHPAHHKQSKLSEITSLYAWHGDHHLAHITSLKTRLNW